MYLRGESIKLQDVPEKWKY